MRSFVALHFSFGIFGKRSPCRSRNSKHVGFSAKRFAEAAGDARRVVEKATPEIDASQSKLASGSHHLPIIDMPQLCFMRDTLVATECGLRPIGEIEPGDKVFGYDFSEGKPVLAEVETRHDNLYDGAVVRLEVNGSWVETTAYHPFWVVEGRELDERSIPRELDPSEDEGKALRGRWVNSHELRAGDKIHLHDGTSARVTRIEQRYEPLLPVSNLTVRGFHTFFVGAASILVHNTSWCDLRNSAVKELGPGVSELQIRRKMAELVDGYDWQKHMRDKGGVDALGRTRADVDAIGMPKIHGHHVSRKKALSDGEIEVQNTLLANDIDPIFGMDNLVYAPNKGHPFTNDENVQKLVKEAVLESAKFKLNKQETKDLILHALKVGAEDFIESRWPEYAKHRIFK